MASQDELIKLALKVEGQAEAEKLRRTMEELRNQLYTTGVAAGFTDKQTLALAEQMRTTETRIAALDKQFGKASGGQKDFGRSVLFVSQGIEDLQYGFSAVLNNLPQIVMAMGGPAGLAGAVSLVGVGTMVLYRHWGDLTAAFGQGHVKTAAEEMAELGKKTEKTADDMRKLKDQAERSATSKEIAEADTEEHRESKKVIDKVLADESSGAEEAAAVLAREREKKFGLVYRPDEQEQLKYAKALETGEGDVGFGRGLARIGSALTGGSETSEAWEKSEGERIRRETEEKVRQRMRKQAEEDLGDAKNLPARLKELRDAGQHDLADRLESATPEGIQRDKDIKEDQEENERRTKVTKAKKKRAEEEAKRAEEKELDDDQRESDRRTAITKAKHKKQVDESAGNLQGRALKALVDGETVTPGSVQGMLAEAGTDVSDDVALSIFKKLNEDITAAIKKHAAEKGLTFEDAARDMVNAEKIKEKEGKLAKQIDANQAESNSFMDRVGNASGLAEPIQQMQMQMRMQGLMQASGEPGSRQADRFGRPTFAEREATIAGINKRADEQLEGQVAKDLLRRGFTRDPNEAAGIAHNLVAKARGATDGETGDAAAVKDNTSATKNLTDEIRELRKGVTVKMGA